MIARRGAIALLGGLGLMPAFRALEPLDGTPVAAGVTAFVNRLPLYVPRQRVAGIVRLWGHGSFKHEFMNALVGRWMQEFRQHQPGITLDFHMYGTASAVGALYTGSGNLAILGEEISPPAARAFERAKGYAPTILPVATGSLDVNFFDYAHMIFVHRDNPLPALSLTDLDAVFGAEHRRGARNIRRWGELGLGGEWADQHIQPYGWKVDEDFALFFSEAVLQGSHRWNNDIREYVHRQRADGTQYDHGQQILDALAADRHGIAVSNVRYAVSAVRAVRLGREPGGPSYAATPENLISQRYPLTRIIPAIVDRPPGGMIEPAVRELLRFILSRGGQQALLTDSGYLPLSGTVIARQLERL